MAGFEPIPRARPLPASLAYEVHWTASLPYPLRDALRRWRSLLGMMVGVGIALGIGMTIMAVSASSVELFTGDYRKSGADLYVTTAGGKLIAYLPGDSPGTIKHARNTLAQIRGMGEVKAAIGTMTWPMEREREGPRRRDELTELVMAVGVEGDPAAIPGALAMEQGRWARRSGEIVLGSRLAREKALGIGHSIRINGRDFTVVGIGRLRGVGFSADSMAYVDWQALRQRADVGDVVNLIIVETDQARVVRDKVAELGSFSVSTPDDLVKQAEDVNASATAVRMIMVALTLVIAGLFVSNMLLRSVAERRIEFATLRAIGIPSRTVLFTIATQAALISMAASVIGVGVSAAQGNLINRIIAAQWGIESLYAPDAQLFGIVFLIALGLAVLSGLYPARQATRVDPALVLREA